MNNYTVTNKNFATYAKQTYETKKQAIEFMAENGDIFEKAIATLIKKYAEVGND